MQRDKYDEILFNINQVASEIQVVPATIRNWEKAGLFVGKRSENNYRVYTMDDLALLKKVRMLSIDQKMSSTAIKTILADEFVTPPYFGGLSALKSKSRYSKKIISKKWRESRENLHLTLEEVSKEVGISVSHLSKLETGNASISFKNLSKLAEFYGESILTYFELDGKETPVVRKGCGEKGEIGLPGVWVESLISQQKHVLFPMIFHVLPDHGDFTSHQHQGEEFIFVLHGEIEVTLNDSEIHSIHDGDSIFFPSSNYHKWRNTSDSIAKIIWVHSPVSA